MGKDTGSAILRFEEGKFFLEVEGKKRELPTTALADEAQLKEYVNQEVEVLYSEPVRQVVGLAAGRRLRIVCYLPPPDPWPPWPPCCLPPPHFPHPPLCYIPAESWFLKGVEAQVRANLARRFLEEGVIGKEVYEKLL